MCIICSGEYKGETVINCFNCPLLKEIPIIEGLQQLDCFNCPLLKEIPVIEGLRLLCCYNCPLLKQIPVIEGLQRLYCVDCPLILDFPRDVKWILWQRCKWRDRTPKMVQSLIVLQRRYRKKKFKRIVEYRISLRKHFYRDLIGVAVTYM